MIRRVLAVLCAAAVGACLAPVMDAAEARKGRKICVIKKRGAKPKRRPCRKPTRKRATPARPAPAPLARPRVPLVADDAAPAIATPAPAAEGGSLAAPPAATGVPAAAPACSPSPWLGVTAEDVGGFRLVLSRTCVPAGRVIVQLRNRDLQEHNVYAEGVAPAAAPREVVGDTDAGVTADGTVILTAGTWRIYCAIDGHESMTAAISATSG